MGNRFDGKVVLVTGGNSGLGLETAKLFASEGARVVITGRRQQALDAAVAQIGDGVLAIRADSASLSDLDRMVDTIEQKAGRVDILFANAGLGEFAPLQQVTEEHYDKAFDVNVKGTLFTIQKVLRLMPDGSAIVVNASMVSVKGFPAFGVYAATKAALRSFVRTWSVDLKERKIRVNAVSPGTIITPGYKDGLGLSDEQIESMKSVTAQTAPSGRVGVPLEVAKAVAFLASDEASYVNGTELFVDGGAAQV
jgi:NAD(P)-dependent dehydrogenase (short-subunit alcohol dehydrogenase family)